MRSVEIYLRYDVIVYALSNGSYSNGSIEIQATTAEAGNCVTLLFFPNISALVPSIMSSPIVVWTGHVATLTLTPPSPYPGPILYYDIVVGYSANSTGTLLYSGNETIVTISNPPAADFRVRATTSAGTGPYSDPSTVLPSNSASFTSQPAFYASLIGAGALIAVIAIIILYRLRRLKHQVEKWIKPTPDEWEYEPSGLTMGMKLGEGAFGVVSAATAINVQKDLPGVSLVAVKICTLTTIEEKNNFIAEANIMKQFGKPWHPNVRIK